MAERPPAVRFVVEVLTNDGHRLNLAVPDGSKVSLQASLGFPGKYARPSLHVHQLEQGTIREVELWPERARQERRERAAHVLQSLGVAARADQDLVVLDVAAAENLIDRLSGGHEQGGST